MMMTYKQDQANAKHVLGWDANFPVTHLYPNSHGEKCCGSKDIGSLSPGV